MEVFMGTVLAFGFNYAPRDWALCWGQLLQISQYGALYSLVSTFYGGDGRVTFGVPELRGRSVVGFGTQPGFNMYPLGYMEGATEIQLAQQQLPQHTHAHSYAGSGGGSVPSLNVNLEVAETHGTKQIPDAGDYIACPSNAFGSALEGKLYVTPAEAASVGTVYVGGVTSSITGMVNGFDNLEFTMETAGTNAHVDIQNPVTPLNYCMALDGTYPPRS